MSNETLNQTKYLRGPWMVERVMNGVFIGGHPHKIYPIVTEWNDEDGRGIGIAVCLLPKDNESPETRTYCAANAKLIAAAPTMYEYIKNKASEGDAEAMVIVKNIGNA